jgi:cytochrome c biogenesis protein CcmG, thiol:disulfide interchange protein DsbE
MSTTIGTLDTPEVQLDGQEAPIQKARSGFRFMLILGLAVFLGISALFGIGLAKQGQTQPTSGPAPDFSLSTFGGETYTLSELRGKVVIINFWASWCEPCRIEAPELEAVWQRYQGRDVVMLGVAYTDTERGALAFIDEFDQTYPNGLDLGTRISREYQITGVPETFVVDQEGNVDKFYMQRVSVAELSADIERLLKGSN